MANMISLGQLRRGQAVVYREAPHLVLSASHSKTGRAGAVAKTKLKNLKSGAIFDATFQGNETLPVTDLVFKKAQFLYQDGTGVHFMDSEYEQIALPLDTTKDDLDFLKEGGSVDIAFWQERPLFLKLPPKVELKVVEAPPAVKGDTANSPAKTVKLETGLEISVPLFVKEGDLVRINTETGEYVERATSY